MPAPADPLPVAGTTAAPAPKPLAADGRPSLIGLDLASLTEVIGALQVVPERQAALRARQLFHWLYHRGACDFASMSTLPKPLRQALDDGWSVARPDIATAQTAADGTRKWLLRFADGQEVETVFIPEDDRGALCISTQVGCTLT
ncbi:MAG: 23S rRNA (adenine(2503)-C(2))-methyltransferase RlmN, partial [Geminicoccaceae bacterium]|nr:23S rRNA (adenine(2503)-C(2))-methyltransferase RlmN [Geminicoccaceae bacterium]